jgi:pilus assembly protein CpaF
MDDLVAAGSVSSTGAMWLEAMVEARLAFLISGGTASGKTTLLSCLLSLVPPTERVLLVEDSGELRPNHPHVVRLEARPPNVEGTGEVTLRHLVRQAMRMRPDRLVVGEVRGAEVVDLLAALNTGHDGGCGTVHANSAADVPARLEALALAARMDRAALHSQVAAGVDAVVHLERDRSGRRRVAEVCVLHVAGDGLVRTVPALEFVDGDIVMSAGAAQLRRRLGLSQGRSARVSVEDGGFLTGAAAPASHRRDR